MKSGRNAKAWGTSITLALAGLVGWHYELLALPVATITIVGATWLLAMQGRRITGRSRNALMAGTLGAVVCAASLIGAFFDGTRLAIWLAIIGWSLLAWWAWSGKSTQMDKDSRERQ